MQIVWLGQGGLMFVSQRHKLLVDPYMTNSLKKLDKKMKRRVGIKKKYFKLKPDVILLTNSHPDHTDEKTLARFISKNRSKKNPLTVISCERSFNTLVQTKDCRKGNHVMFGEGDEWTFESIHIMAVKARTNDRSAFGVVITDLTDGRKYYIASNTLYNETIIDSLPHDIYAAFIPISGNYGCMNIQDAQRFAARLDATYVVPINYGMFDRINPDAFECQGKVVPKPFKVISFSISPVGSVKQRVFDRNFNEKSTPLPTVNKRSEATASLPAVSEPKKKAASLPTVSKPNKNTSKRKLKKRKQKAAAISPKDDSTEAETYESKASPHKSKRNRA